MKAIKEVVGGVREIFRWENLELDDTSPAGGERSSFFAWLLKPEVLPRPAVSVPPDRKSFLNWLFVPESLPPPSDKSGAEGRPSLFATLFSRETLSRDPVPGKKESRRGRKAAGPGRPAGKKR